MSKATIISMILGGLSMVVGFAGEIFGEKGSKDDIIKELEEKYDLTPKNGD